jgi:MoaA/NifB/PqqE/SkfB family radical SAM enzyme
MILTRFFTQAKALMGIISGSMAFGGPLRTTIHLTNRCNLRCIPCFYHSPYLEKPNTTEVRRARYENIEIPEKDYCNFMNLEADYEKTKNLIDELISFGSYRFQFSGHGEVFLYKNFIDLSERIIYAGREVFCFTNGTLMDKSIIDRLIEIKFNELWISVLAGTEEMYDLIHPGVKPGTFSVLRDNLLYLYEKKKSLKRVYPKITLIYVVMKENYKGLMDFARFAASVKADKVLYNPVDEVNDKNLSRLKLNEEEIKYVREEMDHVMDYLDREEIKHNIKYFLSVFSGHLDTEKYYNNIPCYYGWLSNITDVAGNVYPCCRCYTPLGNIYEKTFKEIWNDKPYREFRNKTLNLRIKKDFPESCDCNSCVNYSVNARVYRILNPFKEIGLSHKL